MPRKKPGRLTELEALVMDGVWKLVRNGKASATVREVHQQLEPTKPMAYNTVLTMMRILREKGFLESERKSRTDHYQPLVTREQMGRRSLSEVVDRFFSGSAGALVSQLLASEELEEEEIKAIRREVNRRLRDRAKKQEAVK